MHMHMHMHMDMDMDMCMSMYMPMSMSMCMCMCMYMLLLKRGSRVQVPWAAGPAVGTRGLGCRACTTAAYLRLAWAGAAGVPLLAE